MAYQWVSVFLCLIIFPFLWYVLYWVIAEAANAIIAQYPNVYSDKWGTSSSFIITIWYWLPAIILVPMFIWAVMETLHERRKARRIL
ncbi:MAG: hypothetical protein QXH20_05095 [Candidatus Bathyarchaeia archaeon]